jgi:hypothetical protein
MVGRMMSWKQSWPGETEENKEKSMSGYLMSYFIFEPSTS